LVQCLPGIDLVPKHPKSNRELPAPDKPCLGSNRTSLHEDSQKQARKQLPQSPIIKRFVFSRKVVLTMYLDIRVCTTLRHQFGFPSIRDD
jgi:hypothetical protein